MTEILQVRGKQYQQLVEAITNAFPDTNSLARMLQFRLSKNLAVIAALPNNIEQIAFEVIGVANSEGWTAQFIAAARESRPGNPKLLKLCEDFGLTAVSAQLERKIRDDLGYLDIAVWRTRMGEIEAQVCRVESPSSMGTGFLLGPDVVITNYHVMVDVIKNPARARDVIIRFDYKRLADGTTLNPGTAFRLATNEWLLDESPYSSTDRLNDPGDQTPTTEELDYVLLRLDDDPGNQPVAADKAEPEAPKRKWIEAKEPIATLTVDAAVFIVQHPEAWPLKLAMDTKSVLKTNINGTRVRYRTNTEKGSSGSPVFNDHWELAALHHSGDRSIVPVFNQGIPFAAILGLLDKRGKRKLLSAQG
jgi:hypothetical protein